MAASREALQAKGDVIVELSTRAFLLTLQRGHPVLNAVRAALLAATELDPFHKVGELHDEVAASREDRTSGEFYARLGTMLQNPKS